MAKKQVEEFEVYEVGVKYPWFGGPCPVPENTLVKCWTKGANGSWEGLPLPAYDWSWDIWGVESDIIAFEIVEDQ